MAHAKQKVSKKDNSPEHMREVGRKTLWKKGQSGNPLGPLAVKPITDRLKEMLANPKTLERFSRSAIRKATKGSAKHWELVTDRVEGKVPQQVDLHANVIHTITELDKKNASLAIESIRAFESASETPLLAEIVEEEKEEK